MNEIEKLHLITYNSIDGYYVVHTDKGPVCFHKDKQGLPYINIDASVYDAATILVQTVRSNYKGFTKKDIKAAKAARKLQGMIGSPSEKDYGGMVSINMIKNFPIYSTKCIQCSRDIWIHWLNQLGIFLIILLLTIPP